MIAPSNSPRGGFEAADCGRPRRSRDGEPKLQGDAVVERLACQLQFLPRQLPCALSALAGVHVFPSHDFGGHILGKLQ